jgi:hypothetical protein
MGNNEFSSNNTHHSSVPHSNIIINNITQNNNIPLNPLSIATSSNTPQQSHNLLANPNNHYNNSDQMQSNMAPAYSNAFPDPQDHQQFIL